MTPTPSFAFLVSGLALLLTACASVPVSAPSETVYAVTERLELIRFKSDRPGELLERRALSGLPAGEQLRGMDYRVARGVLYAVSDSGRLYTIDTAQARLQPVASVAPAFWPVQGGVTGFDFNPTVDRIRVVSASAQNLRLHPETNAVVDGDAANPGVQPDGPLRYAPDDRHAGRRPDVAGVAYTYNKKDEKLTTNYAIDRALGALLMQGSLEGTQPVVSPNTGLLRTVGLLGTGPLSEAHFDISDVANTALLAARTAGQANTRLYQLDLGTGRARDLGVVGGGERLLGLAIEP
ncbi:MAG: DUF4394 domain-containing protein [Hylemonella sp.]|uniref:DUF4394 domain-containing protein n=1 Tax=Hylemonella sp. TaxID=2066020 RepID=UPI0022CA7449|nr:DUF4394 domain-containing protein [Hylemonella sp.]MCZ8253559.1 DUF4394 domain-containing protein [Hylemonella sp.]